MKNFKYIGLGLITIAIVSFSTVAYASPSILYPYNGGTGQSAWPINTLITSGTQPSGVFQATSTQPLYVGSIFGTTTASSVLLGKLGVGTNNPLGQLQVTVPTGIGSSNALILNRDGGYGETDFAQYYSSVLNYGLNINGGQFVLNAFNGNIGIATSTPDQKLSVNGAANFQIPGQAGVFLNGNASGVMANGRISVISPNTNDNLIINAKGTGWTGINYDSGTGGFYILKGSSSAASFFAGDGSSASYINATGGNVGIGTTNPGQLLQIQSTGATTYLSVNNQKGSSGGTSAVQFGLNDGAFQTSDAARIEARVAANPNMALDFKTYHSSLTTDMTLYNGNLGVGTSSPGSLLAVGNSGGINFTLATSTHQTTGGYDLMNGGCYAIKGVCVGGGGASSGPVTIATSTTANMSTTSIPVTSTFSAFKLTLHATTTGMVQPNLGIKLCFNSCADTERLSYDTILENIRTGAANVNASVQNTYGVMLYDGDFTGTAAGISIQCDILNFASQYKYGSCESVTQDSGGAIHVEKGSYIFRQSPVTGITQINIGTGQSNSVFATSTQIVVQEY